MKIVHCIWGLNTGGSETMLIDIANEQAKTQEVYVVIVNDSYQQFLLDRFSPKVKIILNKRKPNSHSIWSLIRLNWTLLRLSPDIVHIHNSMLPKAIMPFVRHGMKLIAISEAVREDVLSRGKYDIVTIPNGINIEAIEKRSKQMFQGKMRIIQVARLDAEKKGQDILIDALALLKQRGLDGIEVDFIGEGISFEELKSQTERLGISRNVNFLGLRDRSYIYSHLKEYDLMCHPARYEGFGLTVAEGMAAKLPVLVSDDGGPFEIIERGGLGTAFKMENVEDCADKIEYIYKHYQDVMSLVDLAYEHIKTHYSIERMAGEYIRYYQESK